MLTAALASTKAPTQRDASGGARRERLLGAIPRAAMFLCKARKFNLGCPISDGDLFGYALAKGVETLDDVSLAAIARDLATGLRAAAAGATDAIERHFYAKGSVMNSLTENELTAHVDLVERAAGAAGAPKRALRYADWARLQRHWKPAGGYDRRSRKLYEHAASAIPDVRLRNGALELANIIDALFRGENGNGL
eukprot:tig00020801_g13942.t1